MVAHMNQLRMLSLLLSLWVFRSLTVWANVYQVIWMLVRMLSMLLRLLLALRYPRSFLRWPVPVWQRLWSRLGPGA